MHSQNFIFLFAGLIALLAIEPIIETVMPHSEVAQLAFTLILVVGVWSLQDSRRWFRWGLVLTGVAVVTSGAYAYTRDPGVQLTNLFVIAGFCVMTIALALRQVIFAPGPVSLNRLMGALCIYLLLGTLWAIFYAFIEFAVPNAFRYPVAQSVDLTAEFIYYSFVTLTTLGYGDITPVHPVARTLSYLEAVTGQLFLAVLVATLVGRFRGLEASRAEA
jgi:hypothetical protein